MSAQNNLECQRCISKMIVYTKYANQSYMMHMARDEINNQYAVIMVSPVYPWDGKDDDNRESVFFDLVKDLLNDEMNFEWHASVLEAIETYVQSWSLAWMTTMKKMMGETLKMRPFLMTKQKYPQPRNRVNDQTRLKMMMTTI